MKREITLYKDNDFGDIYTEYTMEELYHDSRYETVYENFYDFIITKIDTGCFEEITATLSDGKTVYPYYFIDEDETVLTVMELYREWLISREWKNYETFGDFLNIPQVDRNAVAFYGFE